MLHSASDIAEGCESFMIDSIAGKLMDALSDGDCDLIVKICSDSTLPYALEAASSLESMKLRCDFWTSDDFCEVENPSLLDSCCPDFTGKIIDAFVKSSSNATASPSSRLCISLMLMCSTRLTRLVDENDTSTTEEREKITNFVFDNAAVHTGNEAWELGENCAAAAKKNVEN